MNLIEQIKQEYPNMNTTRRKIADFIIENPAYCSFLSIREFAKGASCTDVTLIAFSKSLGFSSFAEFRKALQGYVLEWSTPTERMKVIASASENASSLLKKIADAERLSVEDAFNQNNIEKIQGAIDLIKKSKNCFIAAHNASRIAAQYLHYRFLSLGVELIILDLSETHQSVARLLKEEAENTLLISIATPPYGASTIAFSRVCHERGIPIISFSDYNLSPLVELSRIAFICPGLAGFAGVTNSYVPFFSLFDALAFFYNYEDARNETREKTMEIEQEYSDIIREITSL